MALVVAAVTGMAGCGSGPQRATSAGPVTVRVSASRALRVTVPGVATVTGPRGAFRGHGTVTVRPVRSALPFGNSLTAAGTGIDVTFSGVTLARPLTLTFAITGKARRGDVAVVAHRLPGGGWTLNRASATSTQMTVRASSFSMHLPAWLDPDAWLHWLGDRLASLIGGRTPPIACAGGGPAWASLSKQTDEAHTCLIPNADPASHAVRAEAQIKSNRGVALEVDIPPGAAYTWVQDQPWAARSAVWAHLIHQDPNVMALLPAGATLTAGYLRPDANEDLSFQVYPSHWSEAYTLVGDIVDVLSGLAADATGLTTLYLLGKCSGAVDPGSLSAHNPLSTATFSSAFKCVLNDALSRLSSPDTARDAARSLLGPSVDEVDLATAAHELAYVGGKLHLFGWVLQLWPFFRAGWGTIPDAIQGLLTGGASTLINLHLQAAPGQGVAGYSAYLGRWYAHDGEICIGQALDLSAYNSTGDAPCSGSGTSGWERSWGCSYISLSPPQCGFAWVSLSFAYQGGGHVIATAATTNGSGQATTVCTPAGSGQIVPCGGLSPEGVVPVTQTLSLVKAGVLEVMMPQGYFGGFTSDWCSPSASPTDQQHYCPNG
jgi:hypothetical protein